MVATPPSEDVESLKRLLAARDAELAAERAARRAAEASVSSAEALIAHLRLAIEKMKRELYGSRSERHPFPRARAAGPSESRCRLICRASGSSSRVRPPVPAAARPSWRSWVKTPRKRLR
jgi:hypothetical protein